MATRDDRDDRNDRDSAQFFLSGDSRRFGRALKLYPQALRLKAEQRGKRPEELLKLDEWYQNELPKKIKSRGKEAHMVHEELVQLMKWKQTRGKFYPQLSYLVKVNTPRAVAQTTKKAFRKMPNIEAALTALNNLKGVGTSTASALLAAAGPDIAPFMAEECLKAIPEMEGSDFTTKEYLNFVTHIRNTCDRLNKEQNGGVRKWSPHNVELAIWAHCVVSELQPELLGRDSPTNGSAADTGTPAAPTPTTPLETSDESNLEPPHLTNGKLAAESLDEATTSCTEDSLDKTGSPLPPSNKRAAEIVDGSSEENSTETESLEPELDLAETEPPAKKLKNTQ
ncbi:protein amun isoform X2 [Arctopsyche grandis]|uniref:protein amun isoform X2 n=1 Tax=Arctopsyche grandis TaxID=121162 RepID=UPI00406D66E9